MDPGLKVIFPMIRILNKTEFFFYTNKILLFANNLFFHYIHIKNKIMRFNNDFFKLNSFQVNGKHFFDIKIFLNDISFAKITQKNQF